jgi:hypothetical protein
VEAVQEGALPIERRLRGIQVLGNGGVDRPAPEPADPPAGVGDREKDAPAKRDRCPRPEGAGTRRPRGFPPGRGRSIRPSRAPRQFAPPSPDPPQREFPAAPRASRREPAKSRPAFPEERREAPCRSRTPGGRCRRGPPWGLRAGGRPRTGRSTPHRPASSLDRVREGEVAGPSSENRITDPPSPQPKHLKACRAGLTKKDGVYRGGTGTAPESSPRRGSRAPSRISPR